MYLGIFLGPSSRGPGNDHDVIRLCLDQAAQAAKAGFALITFVEQHFNSYEPYCNPFLIGARLSPYPKQAYFGTTIVPLPLHHPLRLAEDINVLDVLTRGQLIVGRSAGRVGYSRDLENFGADLKRRHEMFASKLDIMRRAWVKQADDPDLMIETDFDVRAVSGPEARMMPAPYLAGGPLLAVGSNTDATTPQARSACRCSSLHARSRRRPESSCFIALRWAVPAILTRRSLANCRCRWSQRQSLSVRRIWRRSCEAIAGSRTSCGQRRRERPVSVALKS
ncbi:LLM class flavin-dependent oxidoreductase [Sphingomonas tabacisoli]|uniref:LLM class flavin-dependent oxidoreductase n=1 Tax=Sphingomonas tabacisoli TaxID=2249466 RepID=A0ABW4I0K6_9SPHN